MRKILFGVVITLLLLLVFRECESQRNQKQILTESSQLIQEQLTNVSKLVVTEGNFTEVYRYKDAKELFGNLISAEKKALVVVNAEVQVTYDLSALQFEVDSLNQVLRITSIPAPELKIFPDFEYYDVQADYLNPFAAEDYNLIKENVKASLRKKIKASKLKKNAQNRLLSELSKFYILTNSLGWTLEYQGAIIKDQSTLEEIPLEGF
ncbi:DUF4230 domain-containing protein [Ascidiimonas sp. W6]|uniref:DUF4230 domain-containing protein n=1 Tax=Ascidiimonas meishanensis TaxID=3128903 RepID=UPI0030EDBB06